MKKINIIIYLMFFIVFYGGYISSQYFYFQEVGNGYQQGCDEDYKVSFNTNGSPNGAAGGIFRVKLDNGKIIYSHNITGVLFDGYSMPWPDWVIGDNSWQIHYTDVLISRNNSNNPGLGVLGDFDFASINFIPKYNSFVSIYNVEFPIIYNGGNIDTSLSYGSSNIIDSVLQLSHMTGVVSVIREPCVSDDSSPYIIDGNYSNGNTKVLNFGLNLDLLETDSQGNVPFIRTGGGVNIGVWTGDYAGNPWGINNQYGVDSGSINITVAGNNQSIVLTHDDFNWTVIGPKTWHYLDRDYHITATGGQLFDFGIEKQMTITYVANDRLGNVTNRSISFNHPNDAVVTNIYPSNNQSYVIVDDNVSFKISDDWAGVDSGSVVLTLSGIDNSFFGVYSGTDLNFSGVSGVANSPDYNVVLSGNTAFPASGNITVSVYGTDLEGNGGILANWSFSTAPTCVDLGCCDDIVLSSKSFSFVYPNTNLYISGGINTFFTGDMGSIGYIDCNTCDQGLSIYKGDGQNNTGVFVGFTDLSSLKFQGTNVRAVLSGNTIVLSRVVVSGGGGGGGSALVKDNCPGGDNSNSYYDGLCEGGVGGGHGSPDICNVNQSNYSDELKGAYLYSYAYNITTMCPIKTANLDGYLQRNHFAKMISEFAVNVLGKEPELGKSGCDKFDDINGDTQELKGFMKTACELGLMGLHSDGSTPQKSFDPDGLVTRAQFGTVFSRLLFGYKYNIKDESNLYQNEGYWYKEHLNALKENRIMTKIDGDWPSKLEKRGYVMLMMQRADNYGVFAGKIPILNGVRVLFD